MYITFYKSRANHFNCLIYYYSFRKEFAYSSSDGKVYIRHFGVASSEMTLVNILKGHEAEVTTVVWHHLVDKWITGSEDGTIRIWVAI